MKLFAFAGLFLSALAFAEGTVYVDVGPALGDAAAFPHSPNALVRNRHHDPVKSDLPSPEARDAAFHKVNGLDRRIASLDELDRDLLYIRSREGNLEKLESEYPAIPRDVLFDLVGKVGKAAR